MRFPADSLLSISCFLCRNLWVPAFPSQLLCTQDWGKSDPCRWEPCRLFLTSKVSIDLECTKLDMKGFFLGFFIASNEHAAVSPVFIEGYKKKKKTFIFLCILFQFLLFIWGQKPTNAI